MAAPRAHIRDQVTATVNGTVTPVAGAQVMLYNAGTTVMIGQPVYSSRTGGGTQTLPLITNQNGLIEFWLDYAQQVDAVISGGGFSATTYTLEPMASTGNQEQHINTQTALADTGDLLVDWNGLSFMDKTGNGRTVATLDSQQTFTAYKIFDGGVLFEDVPSAFTSEADFQGGVAIFTLPLTVDSRATFDGGVAVTTLPLTVTAPAAFSGGVTVSGGLTLAGTVSGNIAFTGQETFSGGVAVTTLPLTVSSTSVFSGLETNTGGVCITTLPLTVSAPSTFSGTATHSGGLTISTLPVTVTSRAVFTGGVTIGTLPLTVTGQALLTNGLTVTGDGVVVGAPGGGDQGVGTVNAAGLFVNGVAVASASFATATDVGTANATGAATTFVRSDHVHKYEAATVRWQDASLNGKKLGMAAATGTAAAGPINPQVNFSNSVGFPSTFASTPNVIANAADNSSGYGHAAVLNVTTTGFSIYACIINSAGTCAYNYHAFG